MTVEVMYNEGGESSHIKMLDGTWIVIPPSYKAREHEDALVYILSMIERYGTDVKIVYSWQSEGFAIDVIQLMNKLGKILVTEHNVPIENFVYLCGAAPVNDNIEYYKTYKKMFSFIPNILYLDSVWETQYNHFLPNEPFTPEHSRDPSRKKSFIFLNRKASPHRIIALSELHNRSLLSKCYLSFYDDFIEKSSIRALTPNLAENVIETHKKVLKPNLPTKLTLTDDYYNMYHLTQEDIEFHQNSLFSLISETLFCSNMDIILDTPSLLANVLCYPCVFLTEKTWRTVKQKHPFIILGCVHSLKALREMGYKTFSPYIDESYDNIQNDEERLIAVINEVERLCNMSIEETKLWLEKVHEITEYNFKLNVQKRNYLTKIEVS